MYSPACELCDLRCGVDRASGERGVCGLADDTVIYRILMHYGEELPLVPSLAVWMAGCSFQCSFCSDWDALRPTFPGRQFTAAALAEDLVRRLSASPRPAHNINFVGGEPSLQLPFIADVALHLETLEPEHPPLLLNTNGYLPMPALEASLAIFGIFVVDYKFGNERCGRRIAKAPHYLQTLDPVVERLSAQPGVELWIRHLLMPGHLECCTRPVLQRLSKLGDGVNVNVMPAFVGFRGWSALTAEERSEAKALTSSLPNAFFDGTRL